jgi:predicted protein tyrosine phosphatase
MNRAIHIGRSALVEFEPPEPCLIISIVDPRAGQAFIGNWENRRILGVHRVLPFHDIDVAHEGLDHVLFDYQRAADIATFIHSHAQYHEATLVVAQCEAGISRSAGVAAALQNFFRMDGRSAFDTGIPNRLVFRLTLEALQSRFGTRTYIGS